MKFLPQPGADIRIFRQALRQDMACALDAGAGSLKPFLVFLHEGRGQHQRVGAGFVRQQRLQQRLQAPFPGVRRLGALLGLVGQIEVFQLRLAPGPLHPCLQLGRELALLVDVLEDGCPPLQQFLVIGHAVFHRPDGHLVQGAGGLLAVARDEGNRVPFAQQRRHGGHPGTGQREFLADAIQNQIHATSFRIHADVNGDHTPGERQAWPEAMQTSAGTV